MLVLHVITSLAVGGAEQQLVNVVKATSSPELRHAVCQLGPPRDLAGRLTDLGCEVTCLTDRPRRRHVFAFRGVGEVIRRLRPDIVHSWLFHGRFAAAVAIGRGGPAHVASLQGTDYDPGSIVETGLRPMRMAAQRRVERAISRRAVAYVAASQPVKDSYVARVSIAPGRIAMVPNSVDPDRLRADPRTAKELRAGVGREPGFLFVNVSRLVPGKGHDELLRAFARLVSDDPSCHLLLAGDGPLRERLENVALRLSLQAHVRFLGTTDQIGDLLGAADAFVSPSRSEGYGLALAEAMLAGLPVIAADIPATRALLDGEPAALLFPPGDWEGMLGLMRRLRADPRLGESLGCAARALVADRYTLQVTAPKWSAVYRRAATAVG